MGIIEQRIKEAWERKNSKFFYGASFDTVQQLVRDFMKNVKTLDLEYSVNKDNGVHIGRLTYEQFPEDN